MPGGSNDGSVESAGQFVPSRRRRRDAHAHRVVRDLRAATAPVSGVGRSRREQAAVAAAVPPEGAVHARASSAGRCGSTIRTSTSPTTCATPALPPPGGEAELTNLMGRLMSVELDRHRPLWEVWMIEGLTGGRWALISKVHHCMVDGVSGTDLMVLLLDPSRRPRAATSRRGVGTGAGAERRDAHRRCHASISAHARPSSSAPLGRCCAPRGTPLSALHDVHGGALALGRELRPATTLSIEGAIGPHRRWAVRPDEPRRAEGDPPGARWHCQRRRPVGDHRRVPGPAPRPRRPGRRRRRGALARAGLGAGG